MAPIIRELTKSMINKIAAGEVVERPASVVKELVENSIDAGAKKIVVEIENGGMGSIKITDDGCGIASDQLVLALSPHSTSKCSEPDDLFRIHTLGFRGEALASIAEITHLTLTSRSEDSSEGARIYSAGGERSEVEPIGRAVGTTIEARDIFFNVPARRKFLKSSTAEFGHIQEAIIRLAIPNSNVAFVLKHNGRLIYDLPSSDSELDRLRRLFKDDVASRLVPVESRYRDVRVYGYVGRPELYRSSAKMQYLFLNKRYIQDRSLSHAIKESYRGLIVNSQTGARNPVVFLNVAVPPNFIDFNVHPTKMEVRFVDAQGIYAGLLHSVRDLFLRSDMVDRPNETELADAADRSMRELCARKMSPSIAQNNSIQDAVVKSDNKEDALKDSARQFQSTYEARENRDVNVVDSSDHTQAMDESVAASARNSFFESIDKGAKETKRLLKERAEEQGSRATEQKTIPDQLRLDIDAANDALAEAAELESAERQGRVCVSRKDDTSKKTGEFRKFPPLGAEEMKPARDKVSRVPENYVLPSQGAKTKFDNSASERSSKSSEAPIVSTIEPITVESPNSPRQEPSLLDRVAANNAAILEGKTPWTQRVAFDSKGKPVVQMCSRYLVMETPDGIAIVDQHALHERIMFERIKASLEEGTLDAQRLLISEVVDLTPTEFPVAMENKELFEKIGVQFEAIGGTSVAVNSYPAMMRELPPCEIFTTILDAIQRRKGKFERADLLDFALKQAACKAAIKAGEVMTPEAVVQLIAEAEKEINFHHCPHGRPSTVVLTCEEIDKLFNRL